MPIWDLLVGAVREGLFVLAHLFGGSLGSAIVALSLAVRLALLPLTVRFARRMAELQRRLREVQPEIERLKKRYGGDRRRLAGKLHELYAREGIRMVPEGALLTMVVQLPIGLALLQAIDSGIASGSRFLWIADLARPNRLVAVVAGVLTAAGAAASASATAGGEGTAHPPITLMLVGGLVTLAVVWRVSAGVGLYWAASSVVAIVQGRIVRRSVRLSAG